MQLLLSADLGPDFILPVKKLLRVTLSVDDRSLKFGYLYKLAATEVLHLHVLYEQVVLIVDQSGARHQSYVFKGVLLETSCPRDVDGGALNNTFPRIVDHGARRVLLQVHREDDDRFLVLLG